MDTEILQTGPLAVNTYILKDEKSKEAALIDVGGSFSQIKKHLDEDGYSIKFVLNTHGHFDHVLGEAEIQKDFPNIPIYIHKDDNVHLKHISETLEIWGFPFESEPIIPTSFIDENTDLSLGENKIQIFHTPGHSKGGLSFYVDNKLFSGDSLFLNSIGRTDFMDGNFEELVSSIKTKLFKLPDDTVVYPGHGPSTTIFEEKNNNTYLL